MLQKSTTIARHESTDWRAAPPASCGSQLALLDQAGAALMEIRDLDQIKMIRDKAEAVRKYAQSASLGLSIQNRAAELKLRAQRRAGALLAQMALRGGNRRSKNHSDRLKLSDLGISSNQSTRWQKQATVPESAFRRLVREAAEDGKELTTSGLMRLANQTTRAPKMRKGDLAESSIASNAALLSKHPGMQKISEFVNELSEHLQVIDGMLRPLYTDNVASLQASEKRHLKHLIAESRKIVELMRSIRLSKSA